MNLLGERLLDEVCHRITWKTGFSWAAEYKFCPGRKFRFDRAWPKAKVGLEVDGGIWTRGRHVRGSGYLKDMEKFALAFSAGWWVLRVPWEWIQNGKAEEYLRSHFGAEEEK